MLVCAYEDRSNYYAAVKLLVLSLQRHNPGVSILLILPDPSNHMRRWVCDHGVELIDTRLADGGSYNVKPSVLKEGLSRSPEGAIWIDTDIVVNGALHTLFDVSEDTVVLTQDPSHHAYGSSHRARSWNLSVGRELDGPFNSGVVRVTQRHLALLDDWQDLICNPDYVAAQRTPVALRPRHALGDQDLISALLASERYSDTPVRMLSMPLEILQLQGPAEYSLGRRWQTQKHGMPRLVHAMASTKPWTLPTAQPWSLRHHLMRYFLDSTPYMTIAREYRDELGDEAPWLQTAPSFGLAFQRQPWLKGVELAVAFQLVHWLKTLHARRANQVKRAGETS